MSSLYVFTQHDRSPAGFHVASPTYVKSPPNSEALRIPSPSGNRSKPVRRSWGFAAAVNFASSLRQSFGGSEAAATKQDTSSAKPLSPDAAPPSTETPQSHGHDAELSTADPSSSSIADCGNSEVSSVAQDSKADAFKGSTLSGTHESAADFLSPDFRPLSSGLEVMESGAASKQHESTDCARHPSHADDLEMLQQHARSQLAGQQPSTPGNATTLSSSEASQAIVAGPSSRAGGPADASAMTAPYSEEGKTTSDAASGAAEKPAEMLNEQPVRELESGNQTSASGKEAGRTSQEAAAQEAAAAVVRSPASDGTPSRLMTKAMKSMKIHSVTPTVDAHLGTDEPESPSPLRDGLAFMTPLSAFDPDASPQQNGSELGGSGNKAEGAPALDAVSALPRMQPLGASEQDGAAGWQDEPEHSRPQLATMSAKSASDLLDGNPFSPGKPFPADALPGGTQHSLTQILANE